MLARFFVGERVRMPEHQAALLFDIDGTLADTDEHHLAAFNQVLGPRGHTFDRTRFSNELQGFAMLDIAERFLGEEPPARRVEILGEKEAVFRELAGAHIKPIAGLLELLDNATRRGIPMAAVTNAPRPNAEMVLKGLGIAGMFQALIIADDLPHGKPHPLPYLEGMRAVGADPAMSLAFEDSRSGIRSATSAGLATIGLATSLAPNDLRAAGAVATVKDYRDPLIIQWIATKMGHRWAR